MGVWNEPGMYLEANSLTAGDCCPTSSTDTSMNAYYLCISYAIISYRHQLRGKPSVCNDQCAGHSSWSEAAIVGKYALSPVGERDKGVYGPWEPGAGCSTTSLGAPVRRQRWEGQYDRGYTGLLVSRVLWKVAGDISWPLPSLCLGLTVIVNSTTDPRSLCWKVKVFPSVLVQNLYAPGIISPHMCWLQKLKAVVYML